MLISHSMTKRANSVKQEHRFCTALGLNGFSLVMFIRRLRLLRRTAEYASNVEHEPAGNGTTPACCVRTASKTRTLL